MKYRATRSAIAASLALALVAILARRAESLEPDDPEPFRRVVYVDQNPSVSGSVKYQSGAASHGSKILKLDAPGDFRDGEYLEIDHAGAPCTIWSAGPCHIVDNIIPKIAVHGPSGNSRYCVQISVLDGNGGVSRALNPPGSTCISNAPARLNAQNYVTIKYNRATKDGQIKPGDQAYVFWVSNSGKPGSWFKRGVTNLPTQGIAPMIDDKGGASLVYDEDQVPMLNTTDPPLPGPSAYWWIPDSPPAHDLNDWLLTRIVHGGGTRRLVLADAIANSAAVIGARINHDDGPPIQDICRTLTPHTEIIFGAHQYRIFRTMFGNGSKSFSGIAIGVHPAEDSFTVVAGAGMDRTVFRMSPCFNAGDGISIQGSPANHVKHVALRDLTIDNQSCGFLPNGPTSAALDTSYADDVTIEHVRAVNGATATVWIGAAADGYYFDQSEASGGWGDVFHGDCGEHEPCPGGIWVTFSNFPFGGADGGFGVLSENSHQAPHDVHVDYNRFGCGAGFQGVVAGDFIGNEVTVSNRHMFEAGLFAPDGVVNYGNSDLYIAYNTFDKKIAYGYFGTDLCGDPPSAVQLGNINTGDNRNSAAHNGGPIRFEYNSVITNEPINVFVCDQFARIEHNSIRDFSQSPGHHGLHLACNRNVTSTSSSEMGANRYSGQSVAIYTGNDGNIPKFTSWDGDTFDGVATLIDRPARIKMTSRPAASPSPGVSERDGIQRQEVSVSPIAPASGATVVLSWSKRFADANYTPACTVLASASATWVLRVHHITAQTAAGIAAYLVNDDPRSGHGGTMTCEALHY